MNTNDSVTLYFIVYICVSVLHKPVCVMSRLHRDSAGVHFIMVLSGEQSSYHLCVFEPSSCERFDLSSPWTPASPRLFLKMYVHTPGLLLGVGRARPQEGVLEEEADLQRENLTVTTYILSCLKSTDSD